MFLNIFCHNFNFLLSILWFAAKIVSENFFGGFDDQTEADKKKGRKEWIDEMIMKSKQIKYEKQKERDKTLDLTEELDKEWRAIMPLIGSFDKQLKEKAKEKGPTNTKPDDYDMLVKSLQFETDKAQVCVNLIKF
jgi:nucleolar protein 14